LGTFQRSGGTVNLTGTLNNAGNTLVLDATTGTWQLQGGTISGGAVSETAGAELLFTNFGGTLSGVTFNNDLDLTTINNANATVTNGLTLNNATVNLGDSAGSTLGRLFFQDTQTLGGSGSVLLGGSGSNALFVTSSSNTATLTIAAGISVHGNNGGIFASSFSFINQGTISADTSGGTLTLSGTNWSNAGTLQASNGGTLNAQGTTTNFSAGTLTGGTWQVFANSTLRLMNANITTNAANILLDGGNSNFFSDSGTTDALANLAANASGGTFSIQDGADLTTVSDFSNSGSLSLLGGSTLMVGGNYTQTDGSTTLSNATLSASGLVDLQGGVLSGSGIINASVQNAGLIEVGGNGAAGLLSIQGDYTQAASGVLDMEIGGYNPGTDFDQLAISGTATLDGTLNVSLLNGFAPNPGDSFAILTFAGSSGGFATTNLPSGGSFTLDPTDGTVSF
jgi:hypothetical protein